MEIKILGTGCPKCNKLAKMVDEVIQELGVEATVSKVTDLNEIAKAGIMLTPGLIIDDDIKFIGKVPTKNDLTKTIAASLSN